MKPQDMQKRLEQTFPQSEVQVRDLTGTEDHYEVWIRTDALQGLSRVAQHQTVMGVFDQELKSGEVHALTIRIERKT